MLSQLIPRVKDEFGTITVPTIPIKEDSTVRKIVYIYIKLVTTKRLSITENKKRTRSLLLRPTFFYFIFPILLFFFFFFLLTFDRPIASGHASQWGQSARERIHMRNATAFCTQFLFGSFYTILFLI
jgi:hypothetical protein